VLYEDLTAKALEACFEVMRELGAGFLESVYEKSLLIALRQKGMSAKAQFPLAVKFREQVVGEFYADVLLEDKDIIELKAVRALTPEHYAQVINYLNATGLEVGLLVNFGNPKLEFRRFRRAAPDSDRTLKSRIT
jgi:GxxExxY protein